MTGEEKSVLERALLVKVRFGSKAALTALKTDFRFTPESGLKSDIALCPKSAKNGLMRCNKKVGVAPFLCSRISM